MKKIIIGLAMIFSLSAYAEPNPINQKVIKKFNKFFPHAENVSWYDGITYYGVSFEQGGMQQRIYYDLNGNLFRTIRYYDGTRLLPYIAMKLRENFKNEIIKGVTEIQEESTLVYQVILEDSNQMHVVDYNKDGEIISQKSYQLDNPQKT